MKYTKNHTRPKILTMPHRFKSPKGVILSMYTYLILIFLVLFSVMVFHQAINDKNQALIHFNSMRARFNAMHGIEYAATEINMTAYYSTFATQTVNTAYELIAIRAANLPASYIATNGDPLVIITVDGIYQKLDTDGNGWQAKIFTYGGDYYILAKGIYKGQVQLYIHNIAGISLYDYFMFYFSDAYFNYKTIDAMGGKVHVNGHLILADGSRISNTAELSAFGGFSSLFEPGIKPGEEAFGWPTNNYKYRWPNQHPANYTINVPLDGTEIPVNPIIGLDPDYTNKKDFHIYGERYGLLMKSPSGNISTWDSNPGNLPGTYSPIYPWGDGTGKTTVNGNPFAPEDLSHLYYQNDLQCGQGTHPPCATNPFDKTTNGYYANERTSINGVNIPSRFPNAFYDTPKYRGHEGPSDEQISTNATDTRYQYDQWKTFRDLWPADFSDLTNGHVTGLKDAVLAGPQDGAKYIRPPVIDIEALKAQANLDGLKIDRYQHQDSGNWYVRMKLTEGSTTHTWEIREGNGNFPSGGLPSCGSPTNPWGQVVLFQNTWFQNAISGLTNKAIKLDLNALANCNPANTGFTWPQNGLIIYSDYPVVLSNAKKLGTGGLTVVSAENVYFHGPFNTNGWQPAAAVTAKVPYFLSKDFNFPDTIPYTYHAPNNPNAEDIIDTDGTPYHLPGGSAGDFSKDFTPGYNWLSRNDSKMANKVTENTTYYVSLVGAQAPWPATLERWSYHSPAAIGNDSTPPSKNPDISYSRTIIGAFIQIDPSSFPDHNLLDYPNHRQCVQSGNVSRPITYVDIRNTILFPTSWTGTISPYPCRQNNLFGNWDQITYSAPLFQAYDRNYLTGTLRPPGDFEGRYAGALIKLPFTEYNWTHVPLGFRTTILP